MATEAVVRDFVGTIRSLHFDAEMACLYAIGVQDFASLSGSERLRLSAYLLGVFYALQEMHNLQRESAIDQGVWRGFERLSQEILPLPGVAQWFATRRHFFSEDFQSLVDSYSINPSSIELNPSYARARVLYSHFLTAMGRNDEAAVQIERALELDPPQFLEPGPVRCATDDGRTD